MVTSSSLEFPFVLVPTLLFLAWSLTADSPSKTRFAVLSLVSLKELVFWGWWNVSLWTPVLLRRYSAFVFPILEYTNLRCGGLLLNGIFSYSSAGCIRRSGFSLIRFSLSLCHRRHVTALCMLHRLIRTRIIVCSVSFHLLLSEFDIPELRLQLVH